MADKDMIEQAKERIGREKNGNIDDKVIEYKTQEDKFVLESEVDARVNQVMKKMDLENTIKEVAKVSAASKKVLDDVTNEVGNIKGSVKELSTSSKEVCDGVNCIKNDIKISQQKQEVFETRLKQLSDKVDTMKDPSFSCENCGENSIKELSSFCPNCGAKIPSWLNEDGVPIKGWKPYWDRIHIPQEHIHE